MNRFSRFVSSGFVLWGAIVAAPPYLHWPWAWRLLPWGFYFPGVGWTP